MAGLKEKIMIEELGESLPGFTLYTFSWLYSIFGLNVAQNTFSLTIHWVVFRHALTSPYISQVHLEEGEPLKDFLGGLPLRAVHLF